MRSIRFKATRGAGRGVRASFRGVGLLAVAASALACKSSSPCTTAATAQDICQTCDSTWSAVEHDHGYCAAPGPGVVVAGDCAGYHALAFGGVDGGAIFFYDPTTGGLLGATHISNLTRSCTVAAGLDFVPPDCDTSGFAQLPGWCCGGDGGLSTCGDAGADGP
jgi:hypothetical protein